ncbi:hypothetical protein A6A26_17195 [Pantoea sp. OXWO6B1]|nr:hypothetical protein A6A26_17195 [Pantoea sp. OXWO6B1]
MALVALADVTGRLTAVQMLMPAFADAREPAAIMCFKPTMNLPSLTGGKGNLETVNTFSGKE